MSWQEHTTQAEGHLNVAHAQYPGDEALDKALAMAQVYALLAINAGLEAIWQEVRKQ